MKEQDKKQIRALLQAFHNKYEYIPFVHTLRTHESYAPLFAHVSQEDLESIQQMIDTYIEDTIQGYRTKGGTYFARFYENQSDLFWKFRELNNPLVQEDGKKKELFQTLGKEVETEMFRLEGLLTETMLRRPEGLDKVVGAFYTIVHTFFPSFSKIA